MDKCQDGFGLSLDGEDRFDAVVGLFGMLNVVLGRRSCAEPPGLKVGGWIFGQAWPETDSFSENLV